MEFLFEVILGFVGALLVVGAGIEAVGAIIRLWRRHQPLERRVHVSLKPCGHPGCEALQPWSTMRYEPDRGWICRSHPVTDDGVLARRARQMWA